MPHDITRVAREEGQLIRTEDGSLAWVPSSPGDWARGHYLCEFCGDAMTDDVLHAAQSPTGQEIACCAQCTRGTGG